MGTDQEELGKPLQSPLSGEQMDEWKSVLAALTAARIRSSTELKMHEDIRASLEGIVRVEYEATIKGFGRIDFVVGNAMKIGIEAKVKGDLHSVGTQMQRYMRAPMIEGLILVTSCAKHRKLSGIAYTASIPVHVLFVGLSQV